MPADRSDSQPSAVGGGRPRERSVGTVAGGVHGPYLVEMAKRKPTARDGADREPAAAAGRRKRMVLQLSDAIAAATAALAEEWDCKPTELVNRAMREFLEREGRWPPRKNEQQSSG